LPSISGVKVPSGATTKRSSASLGRASRVTIQVRSDSVMDAFRAKRPPYEGWPHAYVDCRSGLEPLLAQFHDERLDLVAGQAGFRHCLEELVGRKTSEIVDGPHAIGGQTLHDIE